MCRVAIFTRLGTNHSTLDFTAEWAVKWREYIDYPERLFLLFKVLCAGPRRHGPFRLPVLDRWNVANLLELTGTSRHWAECFQSLIDLLRDDDYIQSICNDSLHVRRSISKILIDMQRPETLPSVDLTMYTVPRFDDNCRT